MKFNVLSILNILAALVSLGANSEEEMEREDLFSATSKLENLVQNEFQIVDILDTYLQHTQQKMATIRTYIEEYKLTMSAGRSSQDLVANPLDAYALLKRLTIDWSEVEAALIVAANYSQDILSWLQNFREQAHFPLVEDLHGAAQALVRLQHAYNLQVFNLADGALHGTSPHSVFQSLHDLNARDLLFMGKHAFSYGYYDKTLEWLGVALLKTEMERNATTSPEEIRPILNTAIEMHDDILDKHGPRGINWQTYTMPVDPSLAHKDKYSLHLSEPAPFVPKLFQLQTEAEEMEHYFKLCRGEKLRSAELEARLRCRYVSHGPLKLQPLKLEEHSHDPYIVVIHELVTQRQSDDIIETAKPRLFRSRHRHESENQRDVVSSKRVSQNAWLTDEDSEALDVVTRKIELVTGLKAQLPREAEDYQVANYGIGGLYVTHTDHLMSNPDPEAYSEWEHFVGDRLATVMVYLSDVDAGGATVFPRAGVTLWPQKGSAAFWWNLYRNGEGDGNTRHGACPVLHGSKWVSNKWIRYNEQHRTAPCGLHPLDKYFRP